MNVVTKARRHFDNFNDVRIRTPDLARYLVSRRTGNTVSVSWAEFFDTLGITKEQTRQEIRDALRHNIRATAEQQASDTLSLSLESWESIKSEPDVWRPGFTEIAREYLVSLRKKAVSERDRVSRKVRALEMMGAVDLQVEKLSTADLRFILEVRDESGSEVFDSAKREWNRRLDELHKTEERKREERRRRRAEARSQQVERVTPRCSSCERKPVWMEGLCKKCARAAGIVVHGKIT